MSDSVRIVLVEPTHPGNIGAAARAMKTMGVRDLRLVRPLRFPDPEADARAASATDVLEQARVCRELEEAIGDAVLVLGASARGRRLSWPELDSRVAAREARTAAESGPVAFLFGRERTGLTNREVHCCHSLVRIPADPDYGSLNLAAAVQVLCYEWRMAAGDAGPAPATADSHAVSPATMADMEGLFDHLYRVAVASGFLDPAQPKQVMARLRRLLLRARPDRIEVNILRGLLRAVESRGADS